MQHPCFNCIVIGMEDRLALDEKKLFVLWTNLVLTISTTMAAEEAPTFRKSELLTSQISKSIHVIKTTIFALIYTVISNAGNLRSSSTDIQGCLVLQHIQDALRSNVALESQHIWQNINSLSLKLSEVKMSLEVGSDSPFILCSVFILPVSCCILPIVELFN